MSRDSIRLVSWNCQGGFHSKLDRILEVDADIYVIQEASNPQLLGPLLPSDQWHFEPRDAPGKGLLVFARGDLRIEPRRSPGTPEYRHIVPILISDSFGREIDLWAVWATKSKDRASSYVGQVHLALDDLKESIRANTIVIGDFNSNAIWDTKRSRNHSELVNRFAGLGIWSAYHSHFKEEHGEESRPTFFMHRDRTRSYHIDYCFTDMQVVDCEVLSFDSWSGPKENGGISDHSPVVVEISWP